MTPPWMSEALSFCVKCVGTAVSTSATTAKAAAIASLTVAEVLSELISARLAERIGSIGDSLVRREVSKAEVAEAEAKTKLAEAADAANKTTLHKRKDRAALLEIDAKALANAKTQAEIDAIRSDAEARRIQAIAEGKARLIEAISKLRQEGGDVFFDEENLKRILQLPNDPPEK